MSGRGRIDPRQNRPLLMVVAAAVIAIVAVAAIVLVTRGGDDDASVPPLTAAEKQAGAVRLDYPDRGLPQRPVVRVVGGKRVTLYFVSANGSGDEVTAVLRVGSDATIGSLPTEVTLQKGQSKTVDGFVITLLDAFATGDVSRDAADVTVALP